RTAAEGRRGTPANRPARAGPAAGSRAGHPAPAVRAGPARAGPAVRIAAAHVGSPAAGPRTGRPAGVPAAGSAAGSGSVRSAGTGTAVGAGRTAGRAQVAGPAAGRGGRPHRSCRPQGSALEWAVRSRGDRPATSVLTETPTAPRAAALTAPRAAHRGGVRRVRREGSHVPGRWCARRRSGRDLRTTTGRSGRCAEPRETRDRGPPGSGTCGSPDPRAVRGCGTSHPDPGDGCSHSSLVLSCLRSGVACFRDGQVDAERCTAARGFVDRDRAVVILH